MNRWPNQEEALEFAMSHPSCMLDMEMGTGKTRVGIDCAFGHKSVHKILVVCPKAVVGVWRENLTKFYDKGNWICWDTQKGTIKSKAAELEKWFEEVVPKIEKGIGVTLKKFVVVNYDCVWRSPIGEYIYREANFDMVILDESHRAKAAGSKVSKYLAMLGRRVPYKMCLSGTPMANSPLDVYGQYRFLDPSIFGTNHYLFLQEYAVMGGPDFKFIVGFKNQKRLNEKFDSIAYHCRMSEVADKLKLPEVLPTTRRGVRLPSRDMKTIQELSREFIAECGNGHVIVGNVLTKLLRIQQICSGFCVVKDSVFDKGEMKELNEAKANELREMLEDISISSSVVVFCVFRHDLEVIKEVSEKCGREYFELSGDENTLDKWKEAEGAVIGVQIQAGSEGVNMTKANHAIYFSMPHSLAMYNQSKARLYRPGQTRPVAFTHLIAEGTVDEAMYKSLLRKEDIIESIQSGTFDFGYMH